MKTQILSLEELQKLIPAVRKLEGTSFKNLRDLITNLVNAIEKNGRWEFVQYLNNNPSFFIVREKSQQEDLSVNNYESSPFNNIGKEPAIDTSGTSIFPSKSYNMDNGKLPWEE